MPRINSYAAGAAQQSNLMDSLMEMGGVDLAFLVYAEQIQQMDSFVEQSLKDVQQIQKLRQAINAEIDRIKDWKAKLINDNHANGRGTDDSVKYLDDPSVPDGAQLHSVGFSLVDGNVKKTASGAIGSAGSVPAWTGLDGVYHAEVKYHEISVADLDKEITRLQDLAQGYDNDREIKMLLMQGQLNKKEQAVTLLSNFIKKSNDTQAAVINNLK
jgi:hypothetical protein